MFKKGQSGNPGGRPKALKDVAELCREHGVEAQARIIALMNSVDERVALAAAQTVLDRGFGKAAQTINSTVRNLKDATLVSDNELANIATRGSSDAPEAPQDTKGLH